jgi:aryl-alcohol dehydrogenase-like predicted oxidoreductase
MKLATHSLDRTRLSIAVGIGACCSSLTGCQRAAGQTRRGETATSTDRLSTIAGDDWRRRAPEFQEPKLRRNLLLRDALRPIARRHGTSVSSIAIAWTLMWHGVTGAIIGARTPEQVDGWIGAASIGLTPEDLDDIAIAIQRTGAGAGPTHPTTVPRAAYAVAR